MGELSNHATRRSGSRVFRTSLEVRSEVEKKTALILSLLKVKISQVQPTLPPSPCRCAYIRNVRLCPTGKRTAVVSVLKILTKKRLEHVQCHYTSSVHSSTRSRWKWSAVRPGHFTRWVWPPTEYGTEAAPGRSSHFGGQKHLLPVGIEK